MEKIADLTIAIVCYNSHDVICTCLHELIASNVFSVVLVDNASSDNSGQKLKQKYPQITLLQSEKNLGYGRAANLALKASTTRYFFLINPDLVAGVEAVRQLYKHMTTLNGTVALLAPAVKQKDFTSQGLVDRNWVIGAAMLFDTEIMKTVGYFDDNIFLFSEETDLCFRIRQAGLRILLDTDIYIEHLYRQSSAPDPRIERLKHWHFGWSRSYYYHKHGLAKGKKNPYRLIMVWGLKSLTSNSREKRDAYRAKMQGALAFVRGQQAFLDNGKPQAAFW